MAGQVDEIKEQLVLKSISQANLLFPVASGSRGARNDGAGARGTCWWKKKAEVTTEVAPVLATLVDEERADVLEPTVEVLVDVLAWLVEEEEEVVEAAVSLVETTLVDEEEVAEAEVEVLETTVLAPVEPVLVEEEAADAGDTIRVKCIVSQCPSVVHA